jgi:hypothetical protein
MADGRGAMKTILLGLLAFWLAATSGRAWGELKWWKVGEEGLSWKSQEKSSAVVDFSVSGAIQITGFDQEENLVQRLKWAEGFPPDFVSERAKAYIWDNVPFKQTNLPIVDGDPSTSTGDRFKAFGVSQAGTSFFLDLGARFPMNHIAFFPRQSGQDIEGRFFADDFIRGYEILVNDGANFNQENQPIYTLLKRVEFTRVSIADLLFPLQFIRYLRLNITARNPFEIAEIQLFGAGFAPRGEYLSKVVDLGEAANYNRLEWTAVGLRREGGSTAVVLDADAEVSIQMRTGTDDTPQVYYEIVNAYTRERQEVAEAKYEALDDQARGPVEDDQVNWSLWSPPFATSGEKIDLPSPRRFFQFRVALESRAILAGVRLTSLAVEHAVPPLAQQLIGEISLLDTPRPPGNVVIVPASVPSTFAYDVITDIRSSDLGFDAIRISTPSLPEFKELLIGDPPVSVVPDEVATTSETLTLFFPAHRVESKTSGILRIVFAARVFVQSTFFTAEVFDTQTGEVSQKVLPGDANPEVGSDGLRVLTSAASAQTLLSPLEIVPRLITPNEDGRNDRARIAYSLVQLLRAIQTEVKVFDLAGRRVRSLFAGEESSGFHPKEWDGRDDSGGWLPPGIYLVEVVAHTERGAFVQMGTVAVVY